MAGANCYTKIISFKVSKNDLISQFLDIVFRIVYSCSPAVELLLIMSKTRWVHTIINSPVEFTKPI